jgi:hypothetical protein
MGVGVAEKRGRRLTYTKATGDAICEHMSHGKTLREVCRMDNMPPAPTVRGWVLADVDGFAEQYARARMLQAEAWADSIVEIADDGTGDIWTDENGNERTNSDVIQRSRLRVDTRKWLLAKLHPKQYGDKITTENQTLDKDGNPTAPAVPAVVVNIHKDGGGK